MSLEALIENRILQEFNNRKSTKSSSKMRHLIKEDNLQLRVVTKISSLFLVFNNNSIWLTFKFKMSISKIQRFQRKKSTNLSCRLKLINWDLNTLSTIRWFRMQFLHLTSQCPLSRLPQETLQGIPRGKTPSRKKRDPLILTWTNLKFHKSVKSKNELALQAPPMLRKNPIHKSLHQSKWARSNRDLSFKLLITLVKNREMLIKFLYRYNLLQSKFRVACQQAVKLKCVTKKGKVSKQLTSRDQVSVALKPTLIKITVVIPVCINRIRRNIQFNMLGIIVNYHSKQGLSMSKILWIWLFNIIISITKTRRPSDLKNWWATLHKSSPIKDNRILISKTTEQV